MTQFDGSFTVWFDVPVNTCIPPEELDKVVVPHAVATVLTVTEEVRFRIAPSLFLKARVLALAGFDTHVPVGIPFNTGVVIVGVVSRTTFPVQKN